MKSLRHFADIHSHLTSLATTGHTVVSQRPGQPILPNGYYSVGIHPWDTTAPVTLSALKALVTDARSERTVAIGEAGLDRLRGGDMSLQAAVFMFHARLARRLHKPLIIHCVRAYDELLRLARIFRPYPG